MTNDELIARAEAALEGVTDGPWELRLFQSGTVQVMIREWADGSPNKQHGGSTYGFHSAYMTMHNIGTRDEVETDNEKYRNGRFIAKARDLVPDLIAALKASEARVKELEEAVSRQCDNMAFVLNRVNIPPQWFRKFDDELAEDRAALKGGAE